MSVMSGSKNSTVLHCSSVIYTQFEMNEGNFFCHFWPRNITVNVRRSYWLCLLCFSAVAQCFSDLMSVPLCNYTLHAI